MLAIEKVMRAFSEVRDLPATSRAGLLLMVAAGVGDVALHVVSGDHAGHNGSRPEHAAHLLGVVGMVLVLAGVVVHGARRQLRRVAAQPGGLDPDAHR